MDSGAPVGVETGRLRLFISYSRADLDFADELAGGLEIDGAFDIAIDRYSIIEGEDWKKRLGALIADSDTVVFLLSPASAKSEVCQWEVDEAVRLTKRIVPVLVTPLGAQPAPTALAALNYVRFDPLEDGKPRSFTAGIKGLIRALKSDLSWLREHTRLLARASEWAEAGRPANRLLSGDAVPEAKAWAARRPKDAPALNALHLDFIAESEAAEASRASAAAHALAERERLAHAAEESARQAKAEAERAEQAAKDAQAAQADRLAAVAQAEAAVNETARTQRRAGRLLWGIAALMLAFFGYGLRQAYLTEMREINVYMSLANTALNEKRTDQAMRYALQAFPAQGALPMAHLSSGLEGMLAGAAFQDRQIRSIEATYAFFSPDGSRVLTLGSDEVARSWITETGQSDDKPEIDLRPLLDAHDGSLSAVQFSRDGKYIVTACRNVARVFEWGSFRQLAQFDGHSAAITWVSFSHDGRHVVTASVDNTAIVWRMGDAIPIAVLSGHEGGLNTAFFSPDGSQILTTASDGTARTWDAATGRSIRVFEGHDSAIRSGTYSPDGTRIVTASVDQTAVIWDAQSGARLHTLQARGSVNWAEFSPSGGFVITAIGSFFTGDGDVSARIWNAETGREYVALLGHIDIVQSAAFSDDQQYVLTRSLDGAAKIWRWDGPPVKVEVGSQNEMQQDLAIDRERTLLISPLSDRSIRVWHARDGEPVARIETGEATLIDAHLSPNAQLIASVHAGGDVKVWERETARPVLKLETGAEELRHFAFSSDGQHFATLSTAGEARLWRTRDRELISILTQTGSEITAFAFVGDALATAAADRSLQFWRVGDGALQAQIEHLEEPAQLLELSPDGKQLLSLHTHFAQIWDVQKRIPLRKIQLEADFLGSGVRHVFSPGSDSIALTMSDTAIHVYEVSTGKHMARLWDFSAPASSVSFSQDGTRLVSTNGMDDNVRVWDVASGLKIAQWVVGEKPSQAMFLNKGDQLVTLAKRAGVNVWNTSWLAAHGSKLRERVCAEKLIGVQIFTDAELANPILRGIDASDSVARNPCLRRGPLSLDFWTRLPAQWAHWLGWHTAAVSR